VRTQTNRVRSAVRTDAIQNLQELRIEIVLKRAEKGCSRFALAKACSWTDAEARTAARKARSIRFPVLNAHGRRVSSQVAVAN
jgi:hypothetical protein